MNRSAPLITSTVRISTVSLHLHNAGLMLVWLNYVIERVVRGWVQMLRPSWKIEGF